MNFEDVAPKGEQAIDPSKKDFGRFGKWEDYCDTNLSVQWNGVKGTVTGKVKHHDQIGTVKAGNHFPLGLAEYYFDGIPKTITIGQGKPKNITDKDIICDISKAKTIKVEYNDAVILELDFSGAEIEPAE